VSGVGVSGQCRRRGVGFPPSVGRLVLCRASTWGRRGSDARPLIWEACIASMARRQKGGGLRRVYISEPVAIGGVGMETAAGRYVRQAVRYGSSQAEGGVAARYRDSMGQVGGTWILAMSSVRVAPRSYAWWPGAPGGTAARSPVAALGTVAAVGMYRNDAAVSGGWHLEGSGKVAAGSQNGLLQKIQLPL
jgi:hypothetical protein